MNRIISVTDARIMLNEIYKDIKHVDVLLSDGIDVDAVVIHRLAEQIEKLYLSHWTIQYY